MMQNRDTAHFNMLEQQVRPADVLDLRVLAAIENVKREHFVDDEFAGLAYADTALPIGFGQSILPPIIDGRLLQALNVQEDEEVLEIGTGSGYFTALLAQLAHSVTTVEIVPELSERARQNLERAGVGNVNFCVGDASQQWTLTNRAAVIVATAALEAVSDEYKQSLAVGGRMLAVVGKENHMTVQLIRRVTEREWQTESLFETVIPAMMNAEPKAEFEF